jgi:putative phosphoribosyl transferase
VARAHGAARVVLAVPVGPVDLAARIAGDADETVVLDTPTAYHAVGQVYDDFSQTSDDEVVAILRRVAAAGAIGAVDEEVEVDAGGATRHGHLTIPAGATGIVLFAHGSGSSRHSPRNRYVAGVLQQAGLGTLLFDLLTVEEERDRANVFDVALLGSRLAAVTRWLVAHPGTRTLPVGYFGASTGAAAALHAATEPGIAVAAVVSRGGRPDLAGDRLAEVTAPTLLVVGGEDRAVLGLNREAAARLRCEHRLAVVPGATHLFEEAGTLEQAASLARDWFVAHFERISTVV